MTDWHAAIEQACVDHPDLEQDIRRRWQRIESVVRASSSAESVGKYKLVRLLGRGSFAEVHLAEHEELGGNVAIKILRDPHGTEYRERFRREAEATFDLDSPGICRIYDTGETTDGRMYAVMQFVPGETLAARIEARKPKGPPRSRAELDADAELVAAIADALHVAHERGMVHRDIKPANLMVTPEQRPVILDFGLVQRDEEDHALTLDHQLLGSPAYMAPECFDGRARDRRTDVYALGATLFELVTLEVPYEAPTLQQLTNQITAGGHVDPRRINPAISRDLAAVITTALDPDPRRRYHTAAALAEDLRRLIARQPIRARRAGPLLRMQRFTQRNPTISTALVLLMAMVLTLGLLFVDREEALAKVLRGADVRRLDTLEDEARRQFRSALPHQVEAMQDWLDRANRLAEEAKFHFAWLDEFEGEPADPTDRWVYDNLVQLTTRLRSFLEDPHHLPGIPAITKKLQDARTLWQRSIGDHQDRWARAIAAVQSKYGIEIEPQVGLVPLGHDPVSQLQEFVHIQSGKVPERDAKGVLQYGPEHGIVFVLIPGGTQTLGARKSPDGRTGPGLDPEARKEEAPESGALVTVALDPYFLGKYEVTQAQWQRILGSNPSYAKPGDPDTRVTLMHPVEQVTWVMAEEFLARMGLAMPTEAQWERGARGGDARPTWFGTRREDIVASINVAELSFKKIYPSFKTEDWDDTFGKHAPVHAMRANKYGLHHMLGNVAEHCADRIDESWQYPRSPGTGLTVYPEAEKFSGYALRGGGWASLLDSCRATSRSYYNPEQTIYNIGLRAARPIDTKQKK